MKIKHNKNIEILKAKTIAEIELLENETGFYGDTKLKSIKLYMKISEHYDDEITMLLIKDFQKYKRIYLDFVKRCNS